MKKHIHYFDYLRIISAIGVIYMHVAADPLRGVIGGDWHGMNLITSFAFTAVPLFFMMSGYLLLSDERTLDVTVLLKKRLPRLLVPLITYTVFATLWNLFRADNLSHQTVLSGLVSALSEPAWVHFWYMYTLIALYCISPFLYGALRSLDCNGHIFVLCIIGIISLRTILAIFLPESAARLLNIDILNKLTFFGGHLATFVLGYYLGNLKRRIPNMVLFFVFFAVLGIITAGTYWLTIKDGAFNQAFQNQSSGFEIILASCVFLIFKQLFNRECRLLRYFPLIPLSLSVYLLHNILISVLRYYGYITEVVTFADTVKTTGIVLALSYLIAKTAATIKPLCFPVTGLTYKSACNCCNWVYTFKNRKNL